MPMILIRFFSDIVKKKGILLSSFKFTKIFMDRQALKEVESLCQRKPEQISFINQHVLPARTEAQYYGLTWGLARSFVYM